MAAKKSAAKSISAAEERMRSFAEQHALKWDVPKMLASKKEFLEYALSELKTAELRLPDHLQWHVIATAKTLEIYIGKIQDHIDRGEIGQAVLAGVEIGLLSERIVRYHFQRDVETENRRRGALYGVRERKTKKKNERHSTITALVEARMKAHKDDSLHYARKYVADQLGVSFDSVKRATTGLKPRPKKIKK